MCSPLCSPRVQLPCSSLFPTLLASWENLSAHSPPAWSIFPCTSSVDTEEKKKKKGSMSDTRQCHSLEIKMNNQTALNPINKSWNNYFFFEKYSVTALNYTWTRSENFGIDRLTSPLEGTLRFLGISKTRRVPCSSVTARKCCLAAHKEESNKYAVYSAGAKNKKTKAKTLFKCFVEMTI